jgi:hypothetical protein
MTPQQIAQNLAEQQVAAAWIGAWAAVAQAVGVVAAIAATIWLGVLSARREAEARREANERAERAEAAADARIRLAEERAQAEADASRIAERNRPVFAALGLTDKIDQALSRVQAEYGRSDIGSATFYLEDVLARTGLRPRLLGLLEDLTLDQPLCDAVSGVLACIPVERLAFKEQAPAIVQRLTDVRAALTGARSAIEDCLYH